MNLTVDTLLLIIAGAALLITTRSWRLVSPGALAGAPQAPASFQPRRNLLPAPLRKAHGVVIQMDHHDPAIIRTALNEAEHLITYYEDKGEEVEIEFVALGRGLHMLRNDSSLVKDHVATLSSRGNHFRFTACGLSIECQSRQEGRDIVLVPQAEVTPAGVARIAELQERGWAYIRG